MSTIDKRWIKLGNRNSPQFLKGLQNFVEIAKNHVNGQGKACCPCIRCANSCRHDLETIYAHIHSHGFLQTYPIWNHHGEKYGNHDEIAALFAEITHPTTTNHEMFDVIDDVLAEQDINEDNTNDDGNGLDPEFDALFKELNTELYPGYDVSNYHRAIDELFTTDESKKRLEKNKINRSKHRYPSYHGSESYKQKRCKEKQKGLTPRYIEGFKDSHYKPNKGWATKTTLADS